MDYSFDFAKRLIESAEALVINVNDRAESDRAILYLSCLSCEISMKALLERSGYTTRELRRTSHRNHELLDMVGGCRYMQDNRLASAIRSLVAVPNTQNGTVGTLLSQVDGASTYPSEIRYGDSVFHFSPLYMLECAKLVSTWCIDNDGLLTRP